MSQAVSVKSQFFPIAQIRWVVELFHHIPYWLVALTARVALAQVFWSSAHTHLANWDTTLYMFANSYQVRIHPV